MSSSNHLWDSENILSLFKQIVNLLFHQFAFCWKNKWVTWKEISGVQITYHFEEIPWQKKPYIIFLSTDSWDSALSSPVSTYICLHLPHKHISLTPCSGRSKRWLSAVLTHLRHACFFHIWEPLTAWFVDTNKALQSAGPHSVSDQVNIVAHLLLLLCALQTQTFL